MFAFEHVQWLAHSQGFHFELTCTAVSGLSWVGIANRHAHRSPLSSRHEPSRSATAWSVGGIAPTARMTGECLDGLEAVAGDIDDDALIGSHKYRRWPV